MADILKQNVGGGYLLTSGLLRDPYGLNSFHPASNVNRLEVYIEDGVSTNVFMVNYKSDNRGYPTSVFFPLVPVETVSHVVSGESAPRTFLKLWALVPPQVLQWNANGSSPLKVEATVVQTAGDNLLGVFDTVTALQTAHPATEALYDSGAIAYCYEPVGETNYGFYQVAFDSVGGTYSWELIENPVNQINMVESKQYNVLDLYIQRGNLPRPTSSVTISDEYIRYILAYINSVADRVTDLEVTYATCLAHLTDYNNPHQVQANQVPIDGTNFTEGAVNVQEGLDENNQSIKDLRNGTRS